MYRILKKKRGIANNKKVVVYYLSKGTSKFVLDLVAKKFYKTSPRFFVVSKKKRMLDDVFYRLSQRLEFKKVHVEVYLSITGVLYDKQCALLYEGFNPIKKLHTEYDKIKEVVFL